MRATRLTLVALLGSATLGLPAQEAPPSFPTGAEVVVLDVVAKDRKDRPLDDLRSDELRVSEDGKACKILSLRLVRPGARGPAPGTDAGPSTSRVGGRGSSMASPTPSQASLVVLVFDRLTTETAPLARKGALDFLSRSFPSDTWFAVFKIHYGVTLLHSFTTDRGRLQAAVEHATAGDTFARIAPFPPELPSPAGAPVQPGASGAPPVGLPELREVAGGVGEMARANAVSANGLDTLYGLRAIALALGAVEGRKSLVYFAEAWHHGASLSGVYEEAVSAANRANVAIHTVDARGLTVHSPRPLNAFDQALSRSTAESRAGAGTDNPAAPAPRPPAGGAHLNAGNESPKPLSWSSEDVEDSLRGATLERLADETGGLAIAGTNDLGSGLAPVAEELRQYYEIVYSPANPVLDGRFRRIGVKASRPGVRLRTRAGYFATAAMSRKLEAHQLPLMDALAAETPVRDFPLRSGVLHFAPKGAERECVVLTEVPLSEVLLVPDEAGGIFRGHLSFLAHVKDAAGGVIARLTHDWPIEGQLDGIDEARQRNAVFKRSMPLKPGHYLLEVAVQDRESNATSVTHTPFDVPALGSGLSLGSVVLVRRAEAASEGTATDDPLRVGPVLLFSGLAAPFVAESSPELQLFVSLYPGKSSDPVDLTLELRRGDEVLARATPALPEAEVSGRIPWVGGIPSDQLSTGSYELTVTARQGADVAEERTAIEVVP